MDSSAEKKERQRRRRRVTHRLALATILLTGIAVVVFLLSFIPKLPELVWLRPVFAAAGVCDFVIFFVLMLLELANDRTELLEPIEDRIEEIDGHLEPLDQNMAGIREEIVGVHEQMVKVSNTRWLPDSSAFIGRLGIEMNSAITSEPHRQKAILRLMRLSGHWKMNERLEHAADLLAKFFDTAHPASKWAKRWEVQMLYAVSDNEAFTALLNERVILGKVFKALPTNFRFRLIPRRRFEPSIGLALIDHDIAFVSFDESRVDPFPEEGLVVHGEAINWYRRWFDEMFGSPCAVTVYERGRIEQAGIDRIRKELDSSPN